jgi:hypothetical protein
MLHINEIIESVLKEENIASPGGALGTGSQGGELNTIDYNPQDARLPYPFPYIYRRNINKTGTKKKRKKRK